jgi:hypothetical protein
MDAAARKKIWRSTSLLSALTRVADLLVQLNQAVVNGGQSQIQHAFVADGTGDLQPILLTHLQNGRTVFSSAALLQCLKEIIEYADEDNETTLSTYQLTCCVLGINQELCGGGPERGSYPPVMLSAGIGATS